MEAMLTTMKSILRFAVALPLLVLAHAPVWAQCAMCKEALNSDPDGQRLINGFTWGITFLGVMLIVMTTGVVCMLFWAGRRPPLDQHAPVPQTARDLALPRV